MENASLSFDKRKHPRIKVSVPVKYKLINQSEEAIQLLEQRRASQHGDSKDVSVEGLFLISSERLAKGDILKIEVQLPEESHPVRAFSEVVWTSEEGLASGKYGSGIYFMALKDEDAERMHLFVARCLAEE